MNNLLLRISLLGGVRLECNGTAVSGLASRKAEAAFIYLVCNPWPIPRDTLTALLWPDNDQERASGNLSVVLSSLRQQLGNYLTADRRSLAFNAAAGYWLDVREFESALERAQTQIRKSGHLTRSAAAQLAAGVSLYKGDFLAGFSIRNAPEFEAWLLLEQERLRQNAVKSLSELVEFYLARGYFNDGIGWAQKLLAFDPLQEPTHRQLMRLYASSNQRVAALAQYEQCVKVLADELGVEPYQETVALYQEIKSEAPTTWPRGDARAAAPLFSAAARPTTPAHNLPSPPSSFIGRQAELAEIAAWLEKPDERMLTIVGPGGMGKSRLALEAAWQHLPDFLDGIWYVSLAPVVSAAELVTAVSGALNFTFDGGADPQRQLVDYLRDKELLLALDNFEHLLRDPPNLTLLTDILTEGREIRLLVTSRERLNLSAERLLDLQGLPYPERNNCNSGQDEHWSALHLFTQRAQRLQADFDLAAHETAVIRLCQLVDGLPLALELAATWVRALPITELVAEVERSLTTLATSLRDIPERHRSLGAVLDYSWQLLTPSEQEAYQKLAVFRGGFTYQAAVTVAGASLPLLASLVDKSLLRLEANGSGLPGRYRRHPLLSQYAVEKLATQPAWSKRAQADHAHYFGCFVQEQEKELFYGRPENALRSIKLELENIRLAWRWAVANRDVVILNQVADVVMQAFDFLGLYDDARDMGRQAVAALSGSQVAGEREGIVALGRALGLVGAFEFRLGNYEAALEYSRCAIQTLAPAQPHVAYGHCLIYAGAAAFGLADFSAVINYWQAAATAYHAAHSSWGEGTAFNNLAEVMIALGDFEAGQAYVEQALALARAMQNSEMAANALLNLAVVAAHHGRYPAAEQYGEEALSLHRQVGHAAHTANGLATLARIAYQQGKAEMAGNYLEESVAILRQVGNRLYLVNRLVELGQALLALADYSGAQEALEEALEDALASQTPDVAWRALAYLARVKLKTGCGEEALLAAAVISRQQSGIMEADQLAEWVLATVKELLPAERFSAVCQRAASLELADMASVLKH
jgi:predicted ATPase/DNA-binding SARP family transcriptional activator